MPIYNIEGENLTSIKQVKFKNEKELQGLTEKNLEILFNLKFVATEFQVDNLRIDTLAFSEETKSFVIIEYKNIKNYSVIDQGYSYLSLLLNNKAEFVLKYNLVFNTSFSKDEFDFSQTRVMFISPSYTTYQLRSVEFSDIAFELWKVVKYSNGTVLYDKVNNTNTTASIEQVTNSDNKKQEVNKEIKKYEITHWKYYYVYKVNNKIIASVSVLSKSIKVWVNLKETELNDPDNRTRNVHNVGHRGVGDYEYIIKSEKDFYYFDKLFKQSYDEKI